MISSATHSLSAGLVNAQSQYRTQLAEQQTAPPASKPDLVTIQPVDESLLPTIPEMPVPDNKVPAVDTDSIKTASEENKNQAFQTALFVDNLQHKQDVADIYLDSADDSEDTVATGSNFITPAQAYTTTADYTKRMDLIAAFEAVGKEEPEHSINLLV